MPQSLSSLLTHLVFSTKNREPWLKGVSAEIHPNLAGVLNNVGCPSIQVGGVSDHVHLFLIDTMSPTTKSMSGIRNPGQYRPDASPANMTQPGGLGW